MQKRIVRLSALRFTSCVCALVATANALADKYKANNVTPLNQAASWTNNAVPTAVEFGVWSSNVAAANTTNTLGANLTWGGIKILDPGGPVRLAAGNTLTLMGISGPGIDLSGASQDLTMHCAVTLPTSQTWTVAPGRVLTMSGALTSMGSLTKTGGGTLLLEGTCTLADNTTVSAGTVLVNGSLAAAGTLTLLPGAALGGTGLIGGPVTVQGDAVLTPGVGGLGTLTINHNLTLAGTTVVDVNRTTTPSSDRVAGVATVTYGGVLVVNNLGPALQAGDSFTLFAATAYAGAFDAITPATPGSGLAWDKSGLGTSGTLKVVATPPPCVLFAGLEHCALGDATLNLLSGELVIGNIGSSGKDGVWISLPGDVDGWGMEWRTLDPDGTLPVGSCLQMQMVATYGIVTNGLWGMTTITKVGINDYVIRPDFSSCGATNVTIDVYLDSVRNASVIRPSIDLPCPPGCDWPDDYHVLPSGCVIYTWKRRGIISFPPEVPESVLFNRLVITPNGAPTPSSMSAVGMLASQIPSISITNEIVTPRPPFIQLARTGGGLSLTWPSTSGWVLQQADNLTGPWNDVATSANSHLVVPTGARQFYRLDYRP